MTPSRRSVEVGVLVALCFFLPLFEAPKNILALVYLGVWIANRVQARDFGGRWDSWDTLIAAWIASGCVVATFAGLEGNQWRGASDLLRYGIVFWLVKRSRFTAREIHWVLGALILSTVIGLIAGYAMWTDRLDGLKLHSVGHVNHTAIYIAIMLGVCASCLFAYWSTWSATKRALAIGITAFVLASVVVAASRGALGISALMLLVLGATWRWRWRVPLPASLIAVTITAVVVVVSGAPVLRKHEANVEANNVMANRNGIWRTALAAWERYPVVGVGMRNYDRLGPERLKIILDEAGRPYDFAQYETFPHAHSLYFNTLAERGIIGSAALAAVLLAWLISLVRHRPKPDAPDETWVLWGSALGAWIVTVGVGVVNTTLHHEHAILAVVLLGLWLADLRKRSELVPTLASD
ncbi:MAG: hypothetical protein QOD26_3774 [Betaproteobacteria bacterium]|jgi:O-antigen ligase|nr:hypothetical protein [Betaproteobacteria bacterium]